MSNKSPAPEDPSPSSRVPFSDALVEAVKRQRNPLFLLLIAYAIILVGAGVWGIEILKTLVVPLSVIFAVGVVAWLIYEGIRVRRSSPSRNEGGNVTVGPFASVENTKGSGGKAIGGGASQKGGDVNIGMGSKISGSTLTGGDAESDLDTGTRRKK